MQPPEYMITALNDLGFSWPESDEQKLYGVGEAWQGFHPQLDSIVARLNAAAQIVWTENSGEAIDAFRAEWQHTEGVLQALADGVHGTQVVAPLVMMSAAIVLALKINVLIQIVLFLIEVAQAVAEAFVTGGASLALVALFKVTSSRLINVLISLATEAILG